MPIGIPGCLGTFILKLESWDFGRGYKHCDELTTYSSQWPQFRALVWVESKVLPPILAPTLCSFFPAPALPLRWCERPWILMRQAASSKQNRLKSTLIPNSRVLLWNGARDPLHWGSFHWATVWSVHPILPSFTSKKQYSTTNIQSAHQYQINSTF